MNKDTERRRKHERPVNREESDQDSSSESDDMELEMREEFKRHDNWLKDYHERHPSARDSDRGKRHRDRSIRSGPCLSGDSEDDGRRKGSYRSRKKR